MFQITIKYYNTKSRDESSPTSPPISCPPPTASETICPQPSPSRPESPSTPTSHPESPISSPESPTSPQHPSASTIVPSDSGEPAAKQPRICHSDDVGVFVDSHRSLVSDSDKYRLIEEHFIPGPLYKFPRASNGRSFQ